MEEGMNNLPGPGDEATWGAVTSSSDPRCVSWTFEFDTTIGIGNVDVHIEIEFYGDEPSGVLEHVWYDDIDLSPTITDETESLIRRNAKVAYEKRKQEEYDDE